MNEKNSGLVTGLLGLGAGIGVMALTQSDLKNEIKIANEKLEAIKGVVLNLENIVKKALREELMKELRFISIYIDNGLDQDVTIQIRANREKAYAKSVPVGSPFTVRANSQDARSLSVETSGWLPYIMVELSCSIAPTDGSLTVFRIRGIGDEVKLVDALEVRDTAVHTPDTDPYKILIQEW